MVGSRGIVVAGVAGAIVAGILKATASKPAATKARIILRGKQLAVNALKEISIVSYNVSRLRQLYSHRLIAMSI